MGIIGEMLVNRLVGVLSPDILRDSHMTLGKSLTLFESRCPHL